MITVEIKYENEDLNFQIKNLNNANEMETEVAKQMISDFVISQHIDQDSIEVVGVK